LFQLAACPERAVARTEHVETNRGYMVVEAVVVVVVVVVVVQLVVLAVVGSKFTVSSTVVVFPKIPTSLCCFSVTVSIRGIVV